RPPGLGCGPRADRPRTRAGACRAVHGPGLPPGERATCRAVRGRRPDAGDAWATTNRHAGRGRAGERAGAGCRPGGTRRHPAGAGHWKERRMTVFAVEVSSLGWGHWTWTTLALLAVPALVALNGFFVAAEFALVAVRKTRVEELVGKGVSGARAVQEAVAHLD